MKRIAPLYLLCAFALLGGCKSFKNLSASDNATTTRPKQTSNSNSVFLDNISVTPGDERTSVLNTTAGTPSYTAIKTAKNFNIESAQEVQFKYAMMLDVPVEALTNIPLLEDIENWWGTKYCMGGSTQSCTDCSAFTQNIIRDIYSVQLPRTAEEQYNTSAHIEYADLKEGDLVFFQTTGRTISHVGVYLTNNKFAHASVSSGVMISDLNEDYWKKRYKAAGRVKK